MLVLLRLLFIEAAFSIATAIVIVQFVVVVLEISVHSRPRGLRLHLLAMDATPVSGGADLVDSGLVPDDECVERHLRAPMFEVLEDVDVVEIHAGGLRERLRCQLDLFLCQVTLVIHLLLAIVFMVFFFHFALLFLILLLLRLFIIEVRARDALPGRTLVEFRVLPHGFDIVSRFGRTAWIHWVAVLYMHHGRLVRFDPHYG